MCKRARLLCITLHPPQNYLSCDFRLSAAGVSYNRFAGEIEQRQIVVLDDVDGFLKEMAFLADAFDHEELREVVKKVALERHGLEYDTR